MFQRLAKMRFLLIIAGVLSTFFLGLALVWVNIELVELSYNIKNLQSEVAEAESLNSKLQIEKMNLSSTYRLKEKAHLFELKVPEADQVRKLD